MDNRKIGDKIVIHAEVIGVHEKERRLEIRCKNSNSVFNISADDADNPPEQPPGPGGGGD